MATEEKLLNIIHIYPTQVKTKNKLCKAVPPEKSRGKSPVCRRLNSGISMMCVSRYSIEVQTARQKALAH